MNERVDVDSPALLVGGATTVQGRIENLSRTGAAFAAPGTVPAFAVDARVTLRVPGGGERGTDIEFAGRIVRVEPFCDASGDSLAYAIHFDRPVRD